MAFHWDRIHKIAVARALTDLIDADFIVEEGEIAFLERLMSKDALNISNAMLVEARRMDLAKAVSLLKELPFEQRQYIIALLKELALSDGTCVPQEAIQILALEWAMEYNAFIYSLPTCNIEMGNPVAIYVENEPSAINGIIADNYRTISHEFSIAGIDFVYIPYITNDYQQMNPQYLHKVIHYMLPSVSEQRCADICTDLQSMTTARFCYSLLYKKMNIPLLGTPPSILFKIGESAIMEKYNNDEAERVKYSNYLRVELSENVLEEIRAMIDAYHSMVSEAISTKHWANNKKFLYSGFHRTLFDMVTYNMEQKAYKLIMDVSSTRANIYFEAMDGTGERLSLKLNPQEATLLVMIAKSSLRGKGLDWRDNPPKQIKQQILEEYNRIYRRIGKGKTTRVYKDRTQTNHIKNRIRSLQGVANLDRFVPEHVREGVYSYYVINASENDVEIIE